MRSASVRALAAGGAAASLVGLKVVRANVLSEEWFRKVGHFARVLDRVRDVKGDVVECGVGAGKSFAVIASLVRGSGNDRKLWALSPWTRVDGWTHPSLSGASLAEVRLRLKQVGVASLAGIEFVDGDVVSSLALVTGGIAFAHVDVVLASAVKPCLEKLWPMMVPGGIVSVGWFGVAHDDPIGSFVASLPEGEAQLEHDAGWHDRPLIVKAGLGAAAGPREGQLAPVRS